MDTVGTVGNAVQISCAIRFEGKGRVAWGYAVGAVTACALPVPYQGNKILALLL